MGDHRGSSADSRFHIDDENSGTVPQDKVIGRAFVIVWPLDRAALLERARHLRRRARGARPAAVLRPGRDAVRPRPGRRAAGGGRCAAAGAGAPRRLPPRAADRAAAAVGQGVPGRRRRPAAAARLRRPRPAGRALVGAARRRASNRARTRSTRSCASCSRRPGWPSRRRRSVRCSGRRTRRSVPLGAPLGALPGRVVRLADPSTAVATVLTDDEQGSILGSRWWTAAELATSGRPLLPAARPGAAAAPARRRARRRAVRRLGLTAAAAHRSRLLLSRS